MRRFNDPGFCTAVLAAASVGTLLLQDALIRALIVPGQELSPWTAPLHILGSTLGMGALAALLSWTVRRLSGTAPSALELRQLLLLAALAYGVRLLLMATPGYEVDVTNYVRWSWLSWENGIHTLYDPSTGMMSDSHPGSLYLLKLVGGAYSAMVGPGVQYPRYAEPLFRFLARFPATAADLAIGALLYAWSRRRLSHGWASLVMAGFLFNPAVLFDSALYGQTDSLHALPALAAMILLDRGRPGWGWLAMGAALMVKPQTYLLVPLLVLATGKRFGSRGSAKGAAAAFGGMLLMVMPFILFGTFGQLWRYLLTITELQPVVSANADNLWWTILHGRSFYTADTGMVPSLSAFGLPLSYRTAGLSMLALLHVPVWRAVWRQPRSPALFAWAALSVLVFFSVCTQMHENYLYLALPILAMVCGEDRRLLFSYAALSCTFTLNMALHYPALVELLVPRNPDIFSGPELFWPRLGVSAVHVCLLAWMLVSFLRRPPREGG